MDTLTVVINHNILQDGAGNPKPCTIAEAMAIVETWETMNPGCLLEILEPDGTVFWSNAKESPDSA